MSVDIKIQSLGWEVRAHGNGSRSAHITSMAVAPSQPAAGVTESGNFSQSDEDLASRGLSCHSTIDDLDLDQLNSLFSKVHCHSIHFPSQTKSPLFLRNFTLKSSSSSI